MNDNIFIPGEGYCEYNQDQIKFMRERIFENLVNEDKRNLNISNENKSSCPLDILLCKGGQSDEEEGEYILGLA